MKMSRWCPVHRTLLVLWLSVVYPSLFQCELSKEGGTQLDEMTVADDESELEEQPGVFVPTKEWKVIMEGQHIPPGLHVRMDLQSGLKEARLLEEEEGAGDEERNESGHFEEETEVGDGPKVVSGTRPYGVSDRRGAINKRTKVFSAREVVASMHKEPKDTNTNISNPPRLAWIPPPTPSVQDAGSSSAVSGVGKEEEEEEDRRGQWGTTKMAPSPAHAHAHDVPSIPLTRHRDVEEMLVLAAVLANRSSSADELCRAMEELEYFVHQMSNANDLNVIGGLVLVVRLLNHTSPDVRGWAAHVIGSASQSNPPVQGLALQYGSLPILSHLLSLSEPEFVQRRALFALGALLRGNIAEQIRFIKVHHGLEILGTDFRKRSVQVQTKAVVLLTDFLDAELLSGESGARHSEFPVVTHNEVLRSGWCKHVAVLIHLDRLMVVEKGLLAMNALRETCNFSAESKTLEQLVRQFVKQLETNGARTSGANAKMDAEYIRHLMQLCGTLMEDIHRRSHTDL